VVVLGLDDLVQFLGHGVGLELVLLLVEVTHVVVVLEGDQLLVDHQHGEEGGPGCHGHPVDHLGDLRTPVRVHHHDVELALQLALKHELQAQLGLVAPGEVACEGESQNKRDFREGEDVIVHEEQPGGICHLDEGEVHFHEGDVVDQFRLVDVLLYVPLLNDVVDFFVEHAHVEDLSVND